MLSDRGREIAGARSCRCGWIWVNAEAVLAAELPSLLARCQQALRDGEDTLGRQGSRSVQERRMTRAVVTRRDLAVGVVDASACPKDRPVSLDAQVLVVNTSNHQDRDALGERASRFVPEQCDDS